MRKQSGPLVFLKLGGSLLSDKRLVRSFRATLVRRISAEIALATKEGRLRLLLAHGAGCFAHRPAREHRTREGLPGGGGWAGFTQTRRGVLEMNRRVLAALAEGGVRPVLAAPSAGVLARRGKVARWDLSVLRALLDAGQIPLIHGDAVVDTEIGFTILSTEELFAHLARELRPQRIVLACDVPGVFRDIMNKSCRQEIIPRIDRSNIRDMRRILEDAGRARCRPGVCDVTGGMAAKVEELYDLVRRLPGLEAQIVSGMVPGAIAAALRGERVGTMICAE